MPSLMENVYNPDVLSCIANLSNDEVFTPPEVANAMLNMLPQELFESKETKFLDPACKSGVFLREIAKRLIKAQFPEYEAKTAAINEKKSNGQQLSDEELKYLDDLQSEIDHVFKKQLFGIAITELTSMLSRRSVYCSKYPNGDYSVTKFDNPVGNIFYKESKHVWVNGRCIDCGANEKEFGDNKREGLESHAYAFIHTLAYPGELCNMKFDVVIGNPPYQLRFGLSGGNSQNAASIYHHFINKAQELEPSYVVMITPSRWMTKSAQGIPENWINNQLNSNHFRVMHDFLNSDECFPNLGTPIKGGVNYFLWDKNYNGKCDYNLHINGQKEIIHRNDYLNTDNSGILIRDPMATRILKRITDIEGLYYKDEEKNFSSLVSAKHFFDNSNLLTSNWKDYKLVPDDIHNIKYYISKSFNDQAFGWISNAQLPKNKDTLPLHKVYIPAAGGSGNDTQVLGHPFYGEPNSVCSQTYLVIGYDAKKHNFTKEQCEHIVEYIRTRFFRYLVSIKKKTQNGPRGVYQFVPLQDFSKSYSDEDLFAKYSFDEEEICYIKEQIRLMEE